MITQLKDKFESATKSSEKVLGLIVLPKNWTIRKVQEEFGASNYTVRKAKEIVKEKEILFTPNPKPGHTLPAETINLVQSFYESNEVNRMMPGCKDFVSVRKAGQRVHIQKRLISSNLKETYYLFKEKYPDKKIGFSNFADVYPKHCFSWSKWHTFCVYVPSIKILSWWLVERLLL